MDEELLRTIVKEEVYKNIPKIEGINNVISDAQKSITVINGEFSTAKAGFIKELEDLKSDITDSKNRIESDIIVEFTNHIQKTDDKVNEVVSVFNKKADEEIKSKSEKFDEIYNKVSSLLPFASVESIACSYIESAERHKKDELMWNALFLTSIFVIFCIPIFVSNIDGSGIFVSLNNFAISKNSESSIAYIINLILHSLPFEAPMIWLAIYAVKQGKKSKRLLEEYYHKYTTAMTFIGMQKNVYEQNAKYKGFTLESENQKELNRKFITSIFENPSLTLEKHVTADMPIEELLPLIEKVGQENVKLLLETIGKATPQKN